MVDAIRLQVVPVAPPVGGDFAVEVYVNEMEVTTRGAGLGMDPYDILIPANRLVAGVEPHITPIARCGCGNYGCGMTDIEVTLEGTYVRWDWQHQAPMAGGVTFDRRQYDEEVARAGSDFSWETPERTAGRLVLLNLDAGLLPADLWVEWAMNDWRTEDVFRVCLRDGERYQLFVDFRWNGRAPEQLAEEVISCLLEVPIEKWTASWHAMVPQVGPPTYLGCSWTRERP